MRLWRLGVAIALLGLTACSTTFHGVTVISPPPSTANMNWPPPAVDSLQPILRWQPVEEPEVSYDVIIYEGIVKKTFATLKRAVGEMVYY